MSAAARSLPLPLPEDRADLLDRLTVGLDRDALFWLAGYTAALARGTTAPAPPTALPVAPPSLRITVLFGSQTGNARRAAERLVDRLAADGCEVRLVDVAEYALRDLAAEKLLLVVISTQGDGEPPDDARGFVEHVLGTRAPQLEGLSFGVLGLGDSSYPQFCAIARQLDARFEALGANRWLNPGEADLDIDAVASPWIDAAAAAARELRPVLPLATVTSLRPVAATQYSRASPFKAGVLANQRITGRASSRDTRHVELSLAGSGLTYEPGDALGVWPTNPVALVDEILQVLSLDADAPVEHGGRTRPLRDWLLHEREATRGSRALVATLAERSGDANLQRVLEPAAQAELASLLERVPLVDLFRRHRADWNPRDLVHALRPITPRLYSIASSPLEVGDEVHLTVARVRFDIDGRLRCGAASTLLSDAEPGSQLSVYIEPNTRFRLPQDNSRDVLMVGAGTGVAPFRAFVQQRAQLGATGRNWLLFGAAHADSEFLYQLEWQQALKRGTLHRLDVAFSRDQEAKDYVQHRLLESGGDVFAALQGGAHFYVCGGVAMARDVNAALLSIASTHGALSADAAQSWLDALQAEGRYARDIY